SCNRIKGTYDTTAIAQNSNGILRYCSCIICAFNPIAANAYLIITGNCNPRSLTINFNVIEFNFCSVKVTCINAIVCICYNDRVIFNRVSYKPEICFSHINGGVAGLGEAGPGAINSYMIVIGKNEFCSSIVNKIEPVISRSYNTISHHVCAEQGCAFTP